LQINGILDQVDDGLIKKIKGKQTKKVNISAARKQYNTLKRELRTEASIADLNEQLKTGNYKEAVPREPLDAPALEKALVEKVRLQREVQDRIRKLRANTFFDLAKETLFTSRTMLATADVSFMFRQGLLLSVRRPFKATAAYAKGIGAFFSQNSADAIDIGLRSHPNQIERDRAGLFLAELDGRRNAREELYMSNFFESVPVLGKILAPIRGVAGMSNRSFATAMNLLRSSAFDTFVKNHPEATQQQKKDYARYVNAASGRGSLGTASAAADKLAFIFFAPRFMVSRFQAPLELVIGTAKSTSSLLRGDVQLAKEQATVAAEIAKDWLALAMTGFLIMKMAQMMGADVGDDPESSDFGKIIIDDTRIDIFGGFQQPMRLISAVTIGGLKAQGVMKGKSKQTAIDMGSRFLQYKLSPNITFPVALVFGVNIIGQEQTGAETAIRAYTPLVLQETFDVWDNTRSLEMAAAAALLTATGVGVTEHSPR